MLATSAMAQDQIYLIGDPQGWDINGTTMPLEKTADGVYEGTYDIPDAKFAFRFYTELGDWDANSIGCEVADANFDYKFVDGSFEAPAIEGKGKYFVMNWPGGEVSMKVDLNNGIAVFESDVVIPEGVNYWVTGLGGQWPSPGDNGSVKGVEEDGVYTFVLDIPEGGSEFKIATQGWGQEIGTFAEDNSVIYEPVEAEVVGSGHNFYTPLEGEQTLIFDANEWVVYFLDNGDEPTPGPETPENAPENLYIIGNIVDNSWNPEAAPKADSAVGGVFTFNGIEMEDGAWFSFINELNSDWDFINDGTHRYGPAEGDAPQVAAGMTVGFRIAGDASWNLEVGGTYTFVMDFNTMTLAITEGAGIDSIFNENGVDVIYNLQGVKVNRENMKNGLYIINGKKVMVRK